ncbi:hypothetical protein [Tuberibacillus sp. Marseille-P3662]|nr:hypothetical protein [Tuberibacillus sp. Marseille-P3662]
MRKDKNEDGTVSKKGFAKMGCFIVLGIVIGAIIGSLAV